MEKAKRIYYLNTHTNEVIWAFSETLQDKEPKLKKIGPMASLLQFTDQLLKERAALENMAEQMSAAGHRQDVTTYEMMFGPDPQWESRENAVLWAVCLFEFICIIILLFQL